MQTVYRFFKFLFKGKQNNCKQQILPMFSQQRKGVELMAKDMLDAVFKAEEDCKQRQSEAKTQAENKIKQAKAEAKKLVDSLIVKGNEEAKTLFASAEKENDSQLKEASLLANKQCEQLSQIAEKNRKKVIVQAVNLLTE